MRTLERGLARFPIAPLLAQDSFLLALIGAIVRIGVGERQPERALVVSQAPRTGHKFTEKADRSKALIVEVIGNPIDPRFLERCDRRRRRRGGGGARREGK